MKNTGAPRAETLAILCAVVSALPELMSGQAGNLEEEPCHVGETEPGEVFLTS